MAPRGREKNITGPGKEVEKRGEGLGTGPVGSKDGYSGRPGMAPGAGNTSTRPGAGSTSSRPGTTAGSGNSVNKPVAASIGNMGQKPGTTTGTGSASGRPGMTGTGSQINRPGMNGIGGTRPSGSTTSSRPNSQASSSRPTGTSARPSGGSYSSGSSKGSSGKKGGMNPLVIIVAILAVLFGGGGAGLGLFGGGSSSGTTTGGSYSQTVTTTTHNTTTTTNASNASSQSSNSPYSYGGDFLSSLLGGSTFSNSGVSGGWSLQNNTGKLNTSVASGSRDKRTVIKGSSKDTVTLMVYMCGADLESKSGMATADLQEMAGASIGSNVNIIVMTGGAASWKNSVISNKTTQIYKVEQGGLNRLESDFGNSPMTNPETLTKFINYCKKNYPANRNELIFWNHGGGSISGYGYDEKFPTAGSMNLKNIDKALKNGGVEFDFIGFDACLMATAENALMLSKYADYLIASEETEPGVGWYYTDWLTKLSSNTSMSTLEIGKNIADDFVSVCAKKCPGQKTTLSVIDLAELENTIPDSLSDFAASTMELLQGQQFKVVSNARGSAREFAVSSKIDQVDLVSLANGMNTEKSLQLTKDILSAVKYNKTSSNMTDAYGLSIYFPYQKVSKVQNAVDAYSAIGMDDAYSKCIQKFAGLAIGGQAVSGGASSPVGTLLGSSGSSSSQSSSSQSSTYGGSIDSVDLIMTILGGLMKGETGNVSGLTGTASSFLGSILDKQADAEYLFENQFDASQLAWNEVNGTSAMYLSEEQWGLVSDLELNLFMDDGEGYIDLGLDNVYDFTDDGGLIGDFSGTWLAINDQPVAYYHMDTIDDGDHYWIMGRVPAMLNGDRVNLILVFDDENPQGMIVGAAAVYDESVTETASKITEMIEEGDVIDFLCDYYAYDGTYQDSYYLGDSLTVEGGLTISDVYVNESAANACYRFKDIYGQTYWSPVLN